jgi:hypothetical protein
MHARPSATSPLIARLTERANVLGTYTCLAQQLLDCLARKLLVPARRRVAILDRLDHDAGASPSMGSCCPLRRAMSAFNWWLRTALTAA